MGKIEVVHIHTDTKFLNGTNLFDAPFFNNNVFLIDQENSYKEFFNREGVIVVRPEELNRIRTSAKKADVVVVYELDFIKTRIVLALPEQTKIIWRFFGYELYSKKKKDYVSAISFKYDEWERSVEQEKFWKKILKNGYYQLRYGNHPDKIFQRAVKRIDFMIALSQEEYNEISSYWSYLPAFMKIPHKKRTDADFLQDLSLKSFKKKKIVIGNGRNSYNNHLDILQIVEKSSGPADYDFKLLFNYGSLGDYTRAVREFVQDKAHYELLEEFIAPNEFHKFYQDISALVINSYRQLASGNIIRAIENGTKVYLNTKNSYYKWLQNEGFVISTIEDFQADLETGELGLSLDSARHNQECLRELGSKYSKENFQKALYEQLTT